MLTPLVAKAQEGICLPLQQTCWPRTSSSGSPAYPNSSSGFQINPSAIPLENKFGFDVIKFNNEYDYGIVRGTGRVGAALSPSNGEETFFGPPAFETDSEYLERKINREKFNSNKLVLATAVGILRNKKRGLNRAELNIGIIGKYNKISKEAHGGVGMMAILGPLQIGYTQGNDSYLISEDLNQKLNYDLYSYSAGINLKSLALDYSQLRVSGENISPITVKLMTASILLKRWIITFSHRGETSTRPQYNFETQSLQESNIKEAIFWGVQFAVFKSLLIGCYSNYYLHQEFTAGLTYFF